MSRASSYGWRSGGCHCGEVRFEIELGPDVEAQECNCSICAKAGFIHIIVPESRFRLTGGEQALTSYSFNTHTARHLFCRTCGVKSFYRPRSNPDGWSVNARCLDNTDGLSITVSAFDGAHWETQARALAHLSKEAS